MKEMKEYEAMKQERQNIKIKDGADAVLKNFRIPLKGVYEHPKLFKKKEKQLEQFEKPPKYAVKIMPISKRFYAFSNVIDL